MAKSCIRATRRQSLPRLWSRLWLPATICAFVVMVSSTASFADPVRIKGSILSANSEFGDATTSPKKIIGQQLAERMSVNSDDRELTWAINRLLALMQKSTDQGLSSAASVIEVRDSRSAKSALALFGFIPPLEAPFEVGPMVCAQRDGLALGVWELYGRRSDPAPEIELTEAERKNRGANGACPAYFGAKARQQNAANVTATGGAMAFADSKPRWTPGFVEGVNKGLWKFPRYSESMSPSPPPPVHEKEPFQTQTGKFSRLTCWYGDREQFEVWTFWKDKGPPLTSGEIQQLTDVRSGGGFTVDAVVRSCPSTLGQARRVAQNQ